MTEELKKREIGDKIECSWGMKQAHPSQSVPGRAQAPLKAL